MMSVSDRIDSDNSVIRLSISPFRQVLLIWSGAVLLPIAVLWLFAIHAVQIEERALEGKAHARLVSNMSCFLDDIQPERFLSRTLNDISLQAGFPDLSDTRLHWMATFPPGLSSPERLNAELSRILSKSLGSAPLLLITFGEDAADIAVSGDARFFSLLSLASKRNWKAIVDQWIGLSRRRKRRPTTNVYRTRDGAVPIRAMFGDFAPIYPEPGRIEGFFSARFDASQLWLYIRLFTADQKADAPVLAGYVSVICERHLSRDILLKTALSEPDRELRLNQTVCSPCFSQDLDRQTYLYPLPSPLLHSGERPPATMSSGLQPIPTLMTSIPRSEQTHPWRQLFPSALMLSAFWLLATWHLFSRLNDARLVPQLSLQQKLLVSLGLAIAPPLIALSLIVTSLLDYWQTEKRTLVQQHLQQRLELIETGFTEYVAAQHQIMLRERVPLALHLFEPSEVVHQHLERFLRNCDAPFAFLIRSDGIEFKHELQIMGMPLLDDKSRERLYEVARILVIRILMSYLSAEQFAVLSSNGPSSFFKRDRIVIAANMWKEREMQYFLGHDLFSLDPSFSGFRNGVIKVLVLDAPSEHASRLPIGGFLFLLQPHLSAGDAHFSRLFAQPGSPLFTYEGYDIQAGVFTRAVEFGDTDRRLLDHPHWPDNLPLDGDLARLARVGVMNPWAPPGDTDRHLISACRSFHGYPFTAVITAKSKPSPLHNLHLWLIFAAGLLYFWFLARLSAQLISRSFVDPMRHLGTISSRIGQGEFPTSISLPGQGELSDLASDLNRMCKGLREGRLLSRFVSTGAQASISRDAGTRFEPGGEQRHTAILFSKIDHFHDLVEKIGGEPAVELLNRYFSIMEPAITQAGGILDKYIGDAVMAVFHGDATQTPGVQAVKAAVAMREALRQFNDAQQANGRVALSTGIGISTGRVISGRIGSYRHRLDFTVIGDVVNTAARIESQRARVAPGSILMDADTASDAQPFGTVISIGHLNLKGKTQPVELFELRPGEQP